MVTKLSRTILAVALLGAVFSTQPVVVNGSTQAARAVGFAQKPDCRQQRAFCSALPNFGQVTPTLYRGGQPRREGYAELQKLGVTTVVNLRNDEDEVSEEKKRVEALGMRFVSLPWSGWDRPDNKQVAEFLRLLRANPGQKVFVHCRRGAERTGVMVAAYRIAAQGWTPGQALEEMEEFKFRGLWFGHLKRYVLRLPELLGSDPDFRTLVPTRVPTP